MSKTLASVAALIAVIAVSLPPGAWAGGSRPATIVVNPYFYGWDGSFPDPRWSWTGEWPLAAARAYNARDFGWGWRSGGYNSFQYPGSLPCGYQSQSYISHGKTYQRQIPVCH